MGRLTKAEKKRREQEKMGRYSVRISQDVWDQSATIWEGNLTEWQEIKDTPGAPKDPPKPTNFSAFVQSAIDYYLEELEEKSEQTGDDEDPYRPLR